MSVCLASDSLPPSLGPPASEPLGLSPLLSPRAQPATTRLEPEDFLFWFISHLSHATVLGSLFPVSRPAFGPEAAVHRPSGRRGGRRREKGQRAKEGWDGPCVPSHAVPAERLRPASMSPAASGVTPHIHVSGQQWRN